MSKIKKRMAMAVLSLVLCMSTVLPVMARGRACPSCNSTRTESISNLVVTETVKEPCIHGHYNHKDDVHYLVQYARIYCNNCNSASVVGQVSREEKERICAFAR